MKKIGLAFAAIATLAIAMPGMASAETTVIKKVYKSGGMHDRGWHRGWDRGMHRGWRPHRHADRVVIIKKRRSY